MGAGSGGVLHDLVMGLVMGEADDRGLGGRDRPAQRGPSHDRAEHIREGGLADVHGPVDGQRLGAGVFGEAGEALEEPSGPMRVRAAGDDLLDLLGEGHDDAPGGTGDQPLPQCAPEHASARTPAAGSSPAGSPART